MITVNGYKVTPTIFPDGTSQVWKLPKELLDSFIDVKIVWNFENEREIIDLCSLALLLNNHVTLHMPYLPYARQDKGVSNDATFNLTVLAGIINQLNFEKVTTVDAHNPVACSVLFVNFENIPATSIQKEVITEFEPDAIAYPDKGAYCRYFEGLNFANYMFFDKERNQSTGAITGHKLVTGYVEGAKRVLIIDDLCDGGATFLSLVKTLRQYNPDVYVGLYVTHGLFSKGQEVLYHGGISRIYTTNSLLKNIDGFKV